MTSASHTPINAERNPVVFAKDGEVFANSRDVAAFFDKEHRNVLQAVDALIAAEPNLGHAEFSAGVYTLPQTGEQQHRCFNMTRDGFALLAMGFTGAKALKWKLRYIEAFNAMEAELRRIANSGPTIDLNDAGALRGLLLTYSEKAIELEKQVKELLPSQEALERIAKADGSTCITDTAKLLQMRPKDLFAFLRMNGWIYRRPGSGTDLGYQSKITAGFLEHKISIVPSSEGPDRERCQVRVTPRGLTRLAQLIKPALQLV
ncbi:phage regulatory protein/antirepressor Ant [Rhizobium pusense]|uniref:phage regulatory protein/antirepressor Ant n=1 Tax=Agrobacterium pusense TaxID=648995 RepID=UPI000D1BB144|nr:phage regulatory protein/antirepressor Ant [Agrobacterium pusense]MDH2092279.1 phage regulatory protein/antirepressor Ant [Agrobacterium pusense]